MNNLRMWRIGICFTMSAIMLSGCQEHSRTSTKQPARQSHEPTKVDPWTDGADAESRHAGQHARHGDGHSNLHAGDQPGQRELHGNPTGSSIAAGETFPTVGFEETHEVTVPFPVADVMGLFEPEGRHLIYSWWNPTVLREAKGETLKGLVTVSRMHSHEVYLIVTDHEPEKGRIQYLVLWDDFELQRIDITCTEGANTGSTKVVWKERNAGLHDKGVSMVTKFVTGGHLRAVVERYAKGVEEHLEAEGT